MGEPGPAERRIEQLGRRSAAVLRIVIAVVSGAVALVITSANPATLGAVAAVTVWSLVLATRRAGPWLLAVDTAVIAAACLTERWTVPTDALHGTGSWVMGVASIAVATWQWHSSPRAGAAATAAVMLAAAPGSLLFMSWLGIEAVLARGLYHLVRKGAREADRLMAETEQTRRAATVAAARRCDEREHLAAMHDTAATTLLAIGTGSVNGREPWLADQLADALHEVTTETASPHDQTNLVPLLDEMASRSPVDVDLSATEPVEVPAPAAAAICRAVGEALRNVARHAGVDRASVRVEQRAGRVLVEVVDRGRGFDPELVGAHRRGISWSVVDRVAAAGGRAEVTSNVGSGTTVRVEWPDG